jgi:predicted transport protein
VVGKIEYKKGSDSGVMSQAVSYLSWLDSARHEFEALVKEKLGAERAEALTAWGEVEVASLRHYIAYRRMVNLASVIFRPKHEAILVYLRLDPDTVALEEGFSRDMRGIGHLGTGDLEVRISSAADLEKAGPLIRRAFEAA